MELLYKSVPKTIAEEEFNKKIRSHNEEKQCISHFQHLSI